MAWGITKQRVIKLYYSAEVEENSRVLSRALCRLP